MIDKPIEHQALLNSVVSTAESEIALGKRIRSIGLGVLTGCAVVNYLTDYQDDITAFGEAVGVLVAIAGQSHKRFFEKKLDRFTNQSNT